MYNIYYLSKSFFQSFFQAFIYSVLWHCMQVFISKIFIDKLLELRAMALAFFETIIIIFGLLALAIIIMIMIMLLPLIPRTSPQVDRRFVYASSLCFRTSENKRITAEK